MKNIISHLFGTLLILTIAFLNVAHADEITNLQQAYLSSTNQFDRAEALASFEKMLVDEINTEGPKNRFVIESIKPNPPDYPWIVRFTIEPPQEEGLPYALRLESVKDIAHGSGVGLFGVNSIVRFSGKTYFPIASEETAGGGWLNRATREEMEKYGVTNGKFVRAKPVEGALLFEGNPNTPLTFAFIDGVGFTYLHGNGKVTLANNKIIAFP